MKDRGRRSPLLFLGGILVLYLAVPVAAFCIRLATTGQRGFHDPGLFSAFATSLVAASISAAIVTLLGVPLAYLLARSKSRLATLAGVAVQLPLALPPVMGGVLLVYLVGPYTALGHLFGGALTDTLMGIVLAQSFVASPFLVVAARAAFAAVDPSLEDVAATLGHGPISRFLRVAVPVAAPGIRAGIVLAWLRAFGEYGATVVLAYHPTSLPVYTFTQFSASGLPGTLAPTALALGVAVFAVAIGQLLFRRRRRHRRIPALPVARRPATPLVGPVAFDLDHRVGGFHLKVRHYGRSLHLSVLGPSGSGKSTLLRCLAGLHGSKPGPVHYGGREVTSVPSQGRRVGYVAQGFSLFPQLAVWEQLLFAPDADPSVAAFWFNRLQLAGLEDRMPRELSGGQRQRVALAQALARSPDVLLLDEPLAGLDTPVRLELRRELRDLQRVAGVSTVVVTHDPEEAAMLADEVFVVADGAVLQSGSVRAVYSAPVSAEAARLLGIRNVYAGTVLAPGLVDAEGLIVDADTGELARGSAALWTVAPENVYVLPYDGRPPMPPPPATDATEGRGLAGEVVDVVDLGTVMETTVTVGDRLTLVARHPHDRAGRPGQMCTVELRAVRAWGAASAQLEAARHPAVTH